MRTTVTLLILILLVIGCNNQKNEAINSIDFIPSDADYVLKINNATSYIGEIRNNALLQHLGKENDLTTLQALDFIKTSTPFYICRNNKEVTILYNADDTTFKNDSIIHKETLVKGNTVTFKTDSLLWFIKQHKNTYIISNIKNTVSATTNKAPKEIAKLISATNNKNSATLFFKNNSTNALTREFPEVTRLLANWAFYDIIDKPKSIIFSGITNASNKKISTLLANTTPTVSLTAKIAPENTEKLIAYTFTNSKDLTFSSTIDSTLLKSVTEIGFTFTGEETTSAAFFTLVPEQLLTYCASSKIETYREVDIYSIDRQRMLSYFFKNFAVTFDPKFLIAHENYILLSESVAEIEEQLNHILNNNTLADSNYYINTLNKLPKEASFLAVKNVANNHKPSIEILQASATSTVFYFNFIAEEITSNTSTASSTKNNSTKEVGTFKLENAIITPAFPVVNYVTNSLDIAVQDTKNQLYLIGLDGKILWKKQLDSPIQGSIEQIDIYNNGKLQLAFTTKHNFYLISRLGTNVKNFPIHFNDEITLPTAIFDYDLNHNYRFLIPQNNYLYMVDKAGNSVDGFKMIKTLENISKTPKHIRVGTKDYIVFTTNNNKLYILNRRGQIRIPISEKFNFSGNDIYWYKNAFSATNTSGNLVMVDETGKITRTTLPLQEQHFIDVNKTALVTFSENILTINNHSIALDFGDYTAPEIVDLPYNDFVTITDNQANKVYVYKITGTLVEGFPVYGNGVAKMNFDEKSNTYYLTVKGNDDEVILYEIPK